MRKNFKERKVRANVFKAEIETTGNSLLNVKSAKGKNGNKKRSPTVYCKLRCSYHIFQMKIGNIAKNILRNLYKSNLISCWMKFISTISESIHVPWILINWNTQNQNKSSFFFNFQRQNICNKKFSCKGSTRNVQVKLFSIVLPHENGTK